LLQTPSGVLSIPFTAGTNLSLGRQENRYGLLRRFIKIKYLE